MPATNFQNQDATDPGQGAYVDVVIASGQSVSGSVDLHGLGLVGVLIPAAWTAAGISFLGSPDNATFGKLVDGSGTEVTAAGLVGGEYVDLAAKNLSARFIQVRSGTAGTPVNQGANRSVRLVCKRHDS